MKGLVDSCTGDGMWMDFLAANNDAIMLKKTCEALKALVLEIGNKLIHEVEISSGL